MAIKPAGTPLSLSEIQTEFGGSNPISLSEYYRGGGLVPNGPTANNGIATSGAINMGGFYGATNRIQQTITISANQTNYVANTAKVSGYSAGIMDVTFVINSGIYVSSNTTGGYALNVDTSWAAGDTVTIVNNGLIVGMGGAGGAGAWWNPSRQQGSAGAVGGPAFRAQRAVSFQNNGTIAGGGGGGGGGENGYEGAAINYVWMGGGGGGGGRSGATNSPGGTGGSVPQSGNGTFYTGGNGGAGTSSTAGSGGSGGYYSASYYAGGGGNGGGWGASGATGGTNLGGTTNNYGPYAGGSAGASVNGNSNITWVATGTRLGAIT